MNIKPIKTQADFEAAQVEINELLEYAKPGTLEYDRLDMLSALVAAYDDKHCHIETPTLADSLEYFIEARGLTDKDIKEIFGSQDVVDGIISRAYKPSLEFLQKLQDKLQIPAEILLAHPLQEAA